MLMTGKWIIFLIFLIKASSTTTFSKEKRLSAFINGDFIIGVLFPLHHQPSSKKRPVGSLDIKCGEIREFYGIQRVEVTFQTLDKINKDFNILPNLTLGVEIRDECWYAPVALQQTIEFIRDAITPSKSFNKKVCSQSNITTISNNFTPNTTTTPIRNNKRRGPLIGVVGPGSSSVALQVQNLLQLFHLPQVGYSTTSKDLSDKSRFNYFLRVVPSDFYQAQAILDIVQFFGWTYVSAVNTDENYGQSGIQAFRELAEKSNVCIAREDTVLSNAPDEVFDKVVLNLKQDPNAKVVVCFCHGLTVRGLLKATRRLNITNHFLFIGSDGWADRGDVTEGYEEESWGGFSIRIHSPYVKSFDPYYWSLKPETNLRNPWFKEFWEAKFACSLNGDDDGGLIITDTTVNPLQTLTTTTSPAHTSQSFHFLNNSNNAKKLCTGEENLSEKYRQDSKLSFVIKAIYSLAHGLHDMQQDICGQGFVGVCDKLLPFNGALFKNYLMNISFEYDGEIIEFDEKGDPPGRYDIMNFQKFPDGTYDYVQVGSWNNSLLWNHLTSVQFGTKDKVKSVCAEDCPKGHYKNVQQGGKDKRCCWVCVPCPSGEILDNERESCKKCPEGFTPDEHKIVCNLLPIEYVKWFDTQAIIAIIIATIGFLCVWLTLIIYIKYNNTPIVKSSTKELCYIILIGMLISYLSIFSIISKPSPLYCGLNRFLPSFSFSMIYSALLTKTNRIARILATVNNNKKNKFNLPKRKQKFMSTNSQIIITLILIIIECFILIIILYIEPPNIKNVYLTKKTLLECNITPKNILIPLFYNFFLIILCTIYGIKTRNVPENFNEAKFIGFSMYTTCVIWLAFIPIYFGSNLKVITLSLSISFSSFVIWIFLFIPKLYIILFKPERNNRAYFTTNNTIRCHIGAMGKCLTTNLKTLEKCSTSNSWASRNKEIISNVVGPSGATKKTTISCQTDMELFELFLNPIHLMEHYIPINNTNLPIIKEKNCCDADTCQMKKIIIKLPNNYD